MNIIVFGGGTVGKFGNDFCLRARQEGHNVIIFSHKDNGQGDTQQFVIDYRNIDSSKKIFEQILNNLPCIDLIFFNQVGGGYPSGDDLFNDVNMSEYQYTLNSHVVIPHLFLSMVQDKLSENSKVINMTSNLAFEYDKEGWLATLVGYASGKAWATQLIQGYAKAKKNNTIYFTLSPSINYESEEGKLKYKKWFESTYNLIFSSDSSYNGKIISAWDDRNTTVKIWIHRE